MNNDTAIKEIQKAIDEIRQNGEHHAEFVRSNGELVIAGLEMALNILNSINPEPCDDTISRRAAIKTLKNHLSDTDVPKSYPGIIGALEEWLDRLPSAQPEPCGEVVSREAVVKFFNDWMSALDINCHHQSVADLMIIKGDIKNLPSAQPEIIRCKDCKHRYVDGDNVRFNVCELSHNKAQCDNWYCADAERIINGSDI